MSNQKKKVVILGGGCGGMTAAYYLSSTPELRDKLDVTVYQLGWRLGGKGACGRNAGMHERIEEHGLHVWGGFYYNAFRLMQTCYGELGRPPGAPLRNWDDAFKGHNLVVWEEHIGDQWVHWPNQIPTNSGIPGQGGRIPTLWEYLQMMVGWIKDIIEDFPCTRTQEAARRTDHDSWLASIEHLVRDAESWFDKSPLSLLHRAHDRLTALDPSDHHPAHEHHSIFHLLHEFMKWMHHEIDEELLAHTAARRMYILADLGMTLVRGVFADGLLWRGVMAVDDDDLVEWFKKHGASKLALESAPIRGFYDYFFAYAEGDPDKPRMSAGMGIRHLMRLLCEYKGSLFYKMESGMGDAVFAPIYEVCKRNGVTFKFFHEVTALEANTAGDAIETIRIGRQVTLKHDEYHPLREVKGLPSWPSNPLYDQIDDKQAAELQRRNANLEDPWTDWDNVDEVVLRRGVNFDAAILAVSIATVGIVCKDMIDRSGDWKRMVENLPAIQTAALQLWWNPDSRGLGWDLGNATMTGYGQPLESWSDMSEVIPRECWPAGQEPKTISYFCGPMPTPPMPSSKDPSFGESQEELAYEIGLRWTEQYINHLFPNATVGGQPHKIDFTKLADTSGAKGEERFKAQYTRANYTPSERYVLDLPGTNKYRLEADTSGFSNLGLAGDWLYTGLGGAVESAVITGAQVARALVGVPADVPGEVRSPWPRPRTLQPLVETHA